MSNMSEAARKYVATKIEDRIFLGKLDAKMKIDGVTIDCQYMPTGDAKYSRQSHQYPVRIMNVLDNKISADIRSRVFADIAVQFKDVFGAEANDDYNVFCTVTAVSVSYGPRKESEDEEGNTSRGENSMVINICGAWTLQLGDVFYPVDGKLNWTHMWCSDSDANFAVANDCFGEYLSMVLFDSEEPVPITEDTLQLMVGNTYNVCLHAYGSANRVYTDRYGRRNVGNAQFKAAFILPGTPKAKAIGIEYVKAGFGTGKPTAEQEKARKELLARLNNMGTVEHKSVPIMETLGVDNTARKEKVIANEKKQAQKLDDDLKMLVAGYGFKL